jgi:putative endonuclease
MYRHRPITSGDNEAHHSRRNRHSRDRRQSERLGRLAEWAASGLLLLKGYRILARRVRTPYGELDLIAVRGNRLAFVEVKYRRSLGEAETSVSGDQASRMADAAEKWTWDHPAYRSHRLGLDAVYLAPWRLPRHLIDDLQPL